MTNPTLTEGGPLWVMLLVAGALWIVWAVMVYRDRVPRYRRQTGRNLTIPILFGLKKPKRH